VPKKNEAQPRTFTRKDLASNRRARYAYEILETYEAGIALQGTEIKAMRDGKSNLQGSYAFPEKGELWLYGAHIAPYSYGNQSNHEPRRPRKLLLHKDQIEELHSKASQKGLTIVPLKLYLKGRLAKLEIALARGKRQYQKKRSIMERDINRDIRRYLKQR